MLSSSMCLPCTSTGPETFTSAWSAIGSSAMTPSTSSPVFAFHIWAASAPVTSNCGDIARYRQSWVGFDPAPPGLRSRRSAAPRRADSTRSVTDVIGPSEKLPFCIVSTPAESNMPEPERISELLAASSRYFDGPSAI